MRRLSFFIAALFCIAFAAGTSFSATVSGKVTARTAPAGGVRVLAYPASSASLSGTATYLSEASKEDGLFSFDLPPGEYFFLAEGENLFSFYGRNPVTVPRGGMEGVTLGLVPRSPAPPQQESPISTGILGRVTAGGKPVAGAVVYVYTDLNSRLKGMGLGMAGPTDESGIFEAEFSAGTYYLVARRRAGGRFSGPLQAGDHIGYLPENPIVVNEGETLRLAIPMLEVPEKVDLLADTLFGGSSIRGRILDGEGKPVAGARAVLYDNPTMFNRPLYVSRPTGEDGSYVLSFPKGGTYYVAARDSLGGAPAPGELYGTYDGTPDHSVRLRTGAALEKVDVVVEEMW